MMLGARDVELPSNMEESRTRVQIGFKEVGNPTGTYGATTYRSLGFDNSLHLSEFQRDCHIEVYVTNEEEVMFDIIGVDAPIANALRRILLSEVPTMAIENVFVHNNTSIMHDEQLAHRLGLVPLKIDPKRFGIWEKGQAVTPKNTVKFRLKVKCEYKKDAPRDGQAPPDVLYKNSKVLTGSIEHVPFGDGEQHEFFGDVPPQPVHNDIILCKLRPGQEIHVEMDATKNIGREHAKWSPVATAGYRMLPEVSLKEPVLNEDAEELTALCPANVFDIEDDEVFVKQPRECTMCRECIREDKWRSKVKLARKRDHFIFTVESTGVIPAPTLVKEALGVLMDKCNVVVDGLNKALQRRADDSDEEVVAAEMNEEDE